MFVILNSIDLDLFNLFSGSGLNLRISGEVQDTPDDFPIKLEMKDLVEEWNSFHPEHQSNTMSSGTWSHQMIDGWKLTT